jgi:regulator of nucleoside diphosphate kinase
LLQLVGRSPNAFAEALYDELDSATVVADAELPGDVVAMGSTVTFRDLDQHRDSTVVLVYPAESDPPGGRISILAPVGAALIGLRVGQEIEWPLPGGGRRRIRVTSVRRSGGAP